jgi:hypothetical protein
MTARNGETASEWTPLDALREVCNDDDRLHAAVPTERDGDDLYVLTVRVQAAREGDGEVLHLRTALVDLLDQRAEWTSTGMVVPLTSNLPLGLGRSLVALHNTGADGEEVLVRNGMGGGDDLAEALLGVEEASTPAVEAGEEDGADDGDGAEHVEDDLPEDRRHVVTLTCEDCGAERPESEMVTVSLGAIEYHTCRGECQGGEGA